MTVRSVLWIAFALWMAAGLADYLCHRATRIELTSGARESWLHLAEYLSLGAALALAVFFRTTPLLFTLLAALVLLHTAIGYADVAWTDGRRRISPFEQHVHAFLIVLPIVALGLLAAWHWQDLRGLGWVLRARDAAVPRPAGPLLVAGFFLLAGAPILEELTRCLRARRPPPTAA